MYDDDATRLANFNEHLAEMSHKKGVSRGESAGPAAESAEGSARGEVASAAADGGDGGSGGGGGPPPDEQDEAINDQDNDFASCDVYDEYRATAIERLEIDAVPHPDKVENSAHGFDL